MPLDNATDLPFQQITRQMNKMMDQLQKGYYNFVPSDTWAPNVNLYESDTSYIVCVDLSGVEKQKIDLSVRDNLLILKGSRAVPTMEPVEGKEQKRLKVHLMEIDHGSFSREVELPQNVQHDKIAATYLNGMLWIEVPKN
jgi:HSP20 family protein